MSTKIADIIIPEVFVPYVIQKTAEKSNLVQSGIVVPDPVMDELARSGGKLINLPFFNDLTGDDEVLTDSTPLTTGKITTGQDVAHILMRGRAWGVNDLAKALSGDDPMKAIGDLVANYWVRQEQKTLIQILEGAFAGTNMSSLVYDFAETDVNMNGAKLLDAAHFIDAQGLLGDSQENLTAVVVHSTVYNNWRKAGLIAFIPDPINQAAAEIPTFLGKRVIVDDGVPVTAVTGGNKYVSYLFGRGAIARGEGNAPVPVETDRDSLAGEDILINRRHFILHPRGVKFTAASVAGSSPTNAELATAVNWERVYDVKNIRMVKVVSNG